MKIYFLQAQQVREEPVIGAALPFNTDSTLTF
jgi:hypothetical protein